MPSLDSSRSTCLVACLVARPRAAARPSPMAETASEALCSTPIVALHRLSTRLACRSCSNTLPSTRCTASNENRLMSATWGLMTCSARFVGCLRGRLVKTRWGESGLAKLQCYCVMAASPILFGNHGGAGDSIIPTLVREQNEGIHKGVVLEQMVACKTVCLRRLGGSRSGELQAGRFFANPKVTAAKIVEGWSDLTGAAAAGRHVLAIQDTTEVKFPTTA